MLLQWGEEHNSSVGGNRSFTGNEAQQVRVVLLSCRAQSWWAGCRNVGGLSIAFVFREAASIDY
jgi:hypothetical protein